MANSEDSHQPAAMADFSYRRHVEYFLDVLLEQLPSPYQESDPNRVTIAYFAISALDLLNALNQASDRLLKKSRIGDQLNFLDLFGISCSHVLFEL
jgi:hypothetical protein